MGQSASSASTSSQTSVSTNTITDAYNQAFTRTENLSNVGNVTLAGDGGSSIGGSALIPLGIIGALVVGVFVYMRRKKG